MPPMHEKKEEPLSQRLGSAAMNVFTIVLCGYILYLADVVGVMQRSKRVYTTMLHLSYASYAVFFLIWMYLAVIVQRKNPNWENTHMNYIYVATGAVSIGGLTWTIALWPVFHIWTIPLGIAGLFLFLSLLSLLPASKKKSE